MQAQMIGFQLSPQQRRVWQLQAGSPGLRAQAAVRIDGVLDERLLAAALDRLVARHEILRTTFRSLPGMTIPIQVVAEAGNLVRERIDLSGLLPEARDLQVEAVLANEAEHPFDFEAGSPLRAVLLRLAAGRHLLVLTLPALCADGWTLNRIVRELAATYSGENTGDDAPIQYVQFSELQNELAEAEGEEADNGYWRSRAEVAGLLQVRLPLERPGGGGEPRPRALRLDLPAGLCAGVEELAQDAGSSAAVVLLACWQVLLWRQTEVPDLVVGVASDGRFYDDLEGTLGLLARYLPVSCHLADDPTLRTFLGRAGEALARSSEWQEYFDWSRLPGLPADPVPHLPFCFEVAERPEQAAAGEPSFAVERRSAWIDRFQLGLICIPAEDSGFSLEIAWDDSLFTAEAARRLGGQLVALLESAVRTPEATIGELDPLAASERRLLVEELNQTAVPFPRDATIHSLIEARAEQDPEAVAALWGDRRMTYGELNASANRLARHLRGALGVGPGTPVGIFAERSPEMLVALLAVLKAGGGYVPLVPSYPAQRIAFLLEDTRLPVLLTQQRLVGKLPGHGARLVLLDQVLVDQVGDAEPGEPGPAPAAGSGPDDLAYVIYTSGSTGRPKGVMVSHRNLVHSTWARFAYYREPAGVFLLASPFAFDSSVAGIFWTLCQGGALALPPESFQQDLQGFLDLFASHGVTHLLTLPSVYSLLLEQEGETRRLDSLRAVVVAGEACPGILVERHSERLPGTALFNEYGPTEGTVWSTVYDCGGWEPGTVVPIGRPVPNMRAYLLDARLRPVPAGVPGEIFIGGAGVARGYLGRPELTAERFVPDPFGHPGEAGGRLYRTGDLARFRLDGAIEFLGRTDHQVKIRGYRIELEEIEEALRLHPGVQEVVVMARSDWAGAEPAADEDPLLALLSRLDPGEAGRLLRELTALSDGDAERRLRAEPEPEPAPEAGEIRRVRATPDFRLSLGLREGYVSPPREMQREWLLNQVLAEAAADLEHAAEIARDFVPGVAVLDLPEEGFDRRSRQLPIDEIMEDWQIPLMREMAAVVTESHGDVLEIGFGRGVASSFIQEGGVRSHTIVECNDWVIQEHFRPWRESWPERDIRLLPCRWQDTGELDRFDGIFFHAFPLDPEEFVETVVRSVTFAEHFFPFAAAHLRPGGTFTYLTHEMDSFSRRHQRLVFRHFSSLTLRVVPLELPEDCKDLWWAPSMVVARAVR